MSNNTFLVTDGTGPVDDAAAGRADSRFYKEYPEAPDPITTTDPMSETWMARWRALYAEETRPKVVEHDSFHLKTGAQDDRTSTVVLPPEPEPLPEIRLYVPSTNNYGHQATCINVLYRLVALGYRRITVVYADDREHPVWPKLATLISGLPEAKCRSHVVGDATVSFYEYMEFFTADIHPKPQKGRFRWAPIGITGAFDGVRKHLKEARVDLFLLVDTFVVLQPFHWTELNAEMLVTCRRRYDLLQRFQSPENLDIFALEEELQDDHPQFADYAYYLDDPVYPKDDLARLTDRAPRRGACFAELFALAEEAAIEVCPVYYSFYRIFSATPELLFNLVTAILHSRAKRPRTAPAVIAMLGSVPGTADPYPQLRRRLGGDGWPEEVREALTPLKAALGRVVIVDPGSYRDGELRAAVDRAGEGGVIIVPLGMMDREVAGIHRAVFDYTFSLATLPLLFEGKGTVSLALNLGRPYLRILSADLRMARKTLWDDEAWRNEMYPHELPAAYAVDDAENVRSMASSCHHASVPLVADWDYWKSCAGSETPLPMESVSNFIVEACAEESWTRWYFALLRSVYHDEQRDRVTVALARAREIREWFVGLRQDEEHDGSWMYES